jgi:HlyD family secretion protein
MKKRHIVIIGAIGLVGFILAGFVKPGSQEIELPLATVSPASFEIKVNTVGVLDAARSHMVTSSIRGDKGKIIYLIDDGAHIKEEDVLVRFDPTPFEEDVHNLRVSELELKRLKKGEGPLQMAQLKGEMEKAKHRYTRQGSFINDLDELQNKGYSNPTEIAQAREKAQGYREEYEVAQKKYTSYQEFVLPSQIETLKAGVQQSEMELEQTRTGGVFRVAKVTAALEKARRELETAKSALEHARNELEKTVICAPFSGIAVLYESHIKNQKRRPRIGDTIWQNQPLLYLPDISSMIVKTRVREVDLHKIFLGQTCTVQVDAYPNALFDGRVAAIGVLAEERFEGGRGEKYFRLTVAINGEDSRLRPGMTARMSVLTDNVKNVSSVPIPAIFNEKGKKYCYLHTEHSFRKVAVSLGRQNEDFVEILSGLKEGEKICLVKPPRKEIR